MESNERAERPALPLKAADKPRRHYLLRRDGCYSLHDAAHALDLPEEQLRRAIVLEELPATAVDDDRQYLLRGGALLNYVRAIRPEENSVFESSWSADDCWGLLILFALAILAVCCLVSLGTLQTPPGPRETGEPMLIQAPADGSVAPSPPPARARGKVLTPAAPGH